MKILKETERSPYSKSNPNRLSTCFVILILLSELFICLYIFKTRVELQEINNSYQEKNVYLLKEIYFLKDKLNEKFEKIYNSNEEYLSEQYGKSRKVRASPYYGDYLDIDAEQWPKICNTIFNVCPSVISPDQITPQARRIYEQIIYYIRENILKGPPGPVGPPGPPGTHCFCQMENRKTEDEPTTKDGQKTFGDQKLSSVLNKTIYGLFQSAKSNPGVPTPFDRRKRQTDPQVASCFCKGIPGKPGHSGPRGEKGDKGDYGLPGVDGRPGAKGEPGLPGLKGETGAKGERGFPGPEGMPVAKGEPGLPGRDGKPGDKGEPGLPGLDGKPGAKGEPGLPCIGGKPGTKCDPGLPGWKGEFGKKDQPDPTENSGAKGKPATEGESGTRRTVIKPKWKKPEEEGELKPSSTEGTPGLTGDAKGLSGHKGSGRKSGTGFVPLG